MCISTWLKNIPYVCLTDFLTGKFEEISGSAREDYYSAEEKTCFLINRVKTSSEFDEYDWLVFIDDDAILNIKMLNHIIKYLNKDYVYGLPIQGFPKKPTLLFPSGGSSYYISPSLIKKSTLIVDQKWGTEDVSVGQWIEDNNGVLTNSFDVNGKKQQLNLNGWFPFSDESLKMPPEDVNNPTPYATRLLKTVDDLGGKDLFLKTHMVHHYIRELEIMKYIQKRFDSWTESDLNY